MRERPSASSVVAAVLARSALSLLLERPDLYKHHSGMVSQVEPAAMIPRGEWRPEPPTSTVELSRKTTTPEEDANG